jgi:hypothetical protein
LQEALQKALQVSYNYAKIFSYYAIRPKALQKRGGLKPNEPRIFRNFSEVSTLSFFRSCSIRKKKSGRRKIFPEKRLH